MQKISKNKAFSLVELSIVILIIGVLIAGVGQGLDLYEDSKISAARTITQSSRVNSVRGIALWIDATADSFGKEISENEPVQRWDDINPQNTAKGSFVQSNQAQAPTYITKGINGLPAVKFNGTTQSMFIDNFADITPSNGVTVFLVTRVASPLPATGINTAIFSKRLAAGGGQNLQLTSSNLGFLLNDFHGVNFNVNSDGVYAVSYQHGTISGSPLSRSFLNGRGIFNITTGTPPIFSTASTDYLYLGRPGLTTVPANPTFFGGFIGELLIYDRILSKKDRQSIEAYLGKKWNIKMTVETAY